MPMRVEFSPKVGVCQCIEIEDLLIFSLVLLIVSGRIESIDNRTFVIAGKAKTVFQIIELMAKGEELEKKQETTERKIQSIKDRYEQSWSSSK
jgi:hypothetical protein